MAIEYPKMLFHEDGRTLTVLNEEQEMQAESGFGPDPSDVHRNPVNPAAVSRVDQSGRDDLIEKLIDRMREEFFGGADDQSSDRPRRGRPPNVTRQRAGTFTPSNGDNGNG